MLQLYKNIKILREKRGMSQDELARRTGYTNRSSITKIESGLVDLPQSKIVLFAEALGVSASELMGWDESPGPAIGEELSGMPLIKFPVIGSIAAGYDRCAFEEYTGDHAYFPASELHADPDEYFVLRIKGNSMYPKLIDGDHVLVRRKESVDSGKIAVIIYDSEEATVKRVKYVNGEDWLDLEPINPEYQTRRIENADLEQCRVLGEVVKLQRDL